jgi:hypothetical protein
VHFIYLFLVYLTTLDHVTSNALTIVNNGLEKNIEGNGIGLFQLRATFQTFS